ncbi:fungal-specific transcription factor domain-domain-containing protein [Microdochium bolleyi]|uniref:Fungal-specific transcription factor domain-domain-containing protein n=1 Tax=Microdochium bolleyi TaxID=196109 RepID=A0A136IUZ4_9PEZI|nr:fungal-specific transcription factor domain-domain-containing protein [Microdochium bolleyi]
MLPARHAQPLLAPGTWHLGLALSGTETQDLRRLLRRCRMSLTAIHDPSSPALLQLLLPLALHSSAVLEGLLSLSTNTYPRSPEQLRRQDAALGQLMAEIAATPVGDAKPFDPTRAQRIMASSLLLANFSLSLCDTTWTSHIHGMIGIARGTSRDALLHDATGRFLLAHCAVSDISAMSVGLRRLSHKCWLSWMMPRAPRSPDPHFTSIEITLGYPESLLDIIAQVAELADDSALCTGMSSIDVLSPVSALSSGTTTPSLGTTRELELALYRWTPPSLPTAMSSFQKLALRAAWGIMRRTALLYLWRGQGFHSNVLMPLPGELAIGSQALVVQVLSDLQVTVDICRSHRLSIASTMMWPLAVVGVECTNDPTPARQLEIADLLMALVELFQMHQARHLLVALERLWERPSPYPSDFLSLQLVCNDMDLCIPLF